MDTHNADPPGTRTIKASEFKARCLKLMDEVADSGAEYVITKNGRPISRLIPYRRKPKSLFGIDRETARNPRRHRRTRRRRMGSGDRQDPWEEDHCSS